MITMNNCKQKDEYDFSGVSTSPKPTNCAVNSLFVELDTGKFYYFNGTEWLEIPLSGSASVDEMEWVRRRITGYIFTVPDEILDGITKFGAYAFYGCKLREITVPSTVTEINNNAFEKCENLEKINLLPTTPPTLGTDALKDTPNNLKIYVPSGTGQTYKDASGWHNYEDKIYEMEG